MRRLQSIYHGAISALLVLGISTSVASANETYGDHKVSSEESSYYDGSYIKVGRKGRRNTAIALGAIALGTILYNQNQNQQRQRNYPRNSGNSHVNWCYNRYRSYRAYDNTFQPYNGPRRQCYSPYQ